MIQFLVGKTTGFSLIGIGKRRMKLYSSVFVLLFAWTIQEAESSKPFEGYQILRVGPKNEEDVSILRRMETEYSGNPHVDFWKSVSTKPFEIFTSQNESVNLIGQLKAKGIPVKTMDDFDINRMIAEEAEGMSTDENAFDDRQNPSQFVLDMYHSHVEINSFLKVLARTYPKICSVFVAGYSFEGRQMLGIKIGNNPSNPSFWIDANIHAREWIAGTTATFIINQLVTKYGKLQSVTSMVNAMNFYILPIANPDGYEYSRSSPSNRFWRKTRSTYHVTIFEGCYGSDPNRNFNWHFNTTGVSSTHCSNLYPGPYAFSEPETRNIRDMILKLKANNHLKVYLSLHSYGQQWLVPYGSNVHLFPPNYANMFELATQGVNAIHAVHKSFYVAINSAELYESSGAADDWARGVANVTYTSTLEIRPQSDPPGFNLPASQIMPTGEEVFEGIKAAAYYAIHN